MKFYVASRASIPTRPAMWRALRREGVEITSSWIDEAGDGETACFTDLWTRITEEISRADVLVLYAETGDFPLKGALIEVGIAVGMGLPVIVCFPGVTLDGRTSRPVGSWIAHPLVTRQDDLRLAVGLKRDAPRPPASRTSIRRSHRAEGRNWVD
jgi:hypothetical protein